MSTSSTEPSARPPGRRRTFRIGLVALVLITALVLTALHLRELSPASHHESAEGHHHHDHATHATLSEQIAPPTGTRWETDAPLRSGMTAIAAAVAPVLSAQGAGTLKSTDVQHLRQVLNDEFATMAAQCQLSPEADAALHIVVVQLMEAAAQLEHNPTATPAARQLVAALEAYETAFDHPGWPGVGGRG
jgi:hypothetical protein